MTVGDSHGYVPASL